MLTFTQQTFACKDKYIQNTTSFFLFKRCGCSLENKALNQQKYTHYLTVKKLSNSTQLICCFLQWYSDKWSWKHYTNQKAVHPELPICFTCNTCIWEISSIELWITATKYQLTTLFSRWVPVQIEWEHWLINQSLLFNVLENWQNTVHWNCRICHTENSVKLGSNKCDSRLRNSFSKRLINHLPKTEHTPHLLYCPVHQQPTKLHSSWKRQH